jgi:transcriptional regulator with XRE-family HTH domain
MPQTFGEILKSLRTENNVGQVELANKIGVSKAIISLWETNKRQPTLFALVALADFFNISLDILCGRSD